MKLYLECYPCLLKQALNTSKLLGFDEIKAKIVIDKIIEFIMEKREDVTAPHIIVDLYDFIHKTFYNGKDIFDPYKCIKYKNNVTALKYYDKLQKMIPVSSSSFETAVKIAAAGNIIDFGANDQGYINIDQEIENIDILEFDIFDILSFQEDLKKVEMLLYIGDNAGEIVFDKVLITEIKKEYPDINIVFAVREKPIINDVTLEDAKFVGLDDEVKVISSGSIYPGTVLSEASKEFQNIFNSAGIIIAKGQGNYETLSTVKNQNLFFLLRIKCNIVSKNIGADVDSLVFWRNK